MNDLLKQLTDGDAEARAALLALDEDAVNPLIDAFHAGVSEAGGLAIIDLVAEIGGPDALTLLRYVYHFEARPAWKTAARRGLLLNRSNLDASELAELTGDPDSP